MEDTPGLHLNLNLDSHLCPARINLVTLASDFISLRCPPPRAMGFPGWKDLAHHVSSPPPSYLKYEVMVIPASQIYTHTFLVLFFFFFTKLLLPELIQNSLIQINYQRNILEQSASRLRSRTGLGWLLIPVVGAPHLSSFICKMGMLTVTTS